MFFRPYLPHPWLVLVATLGLHCTDVDLIDAPVDTKLKLEGRFCTEGSDDVFLPTKVLFAVDVTSSMGFVDAQGIEWGNDPRALREAAVRRVISEFCGRDNFSFDIVRFAEHDHAMRPEDVTGGFLKCEGPEDLVTRFGPALEKIKEHEGWTPYVTTLEEVQRVISEDIDSMSEKEANLTSYAVIFFSDGEPCHTAQNADGTWRYFGEDFEIIHDQIENVVALGSRVADVVVHTAYLKNDSVDDCNNDWTDEIQSPEDLLATMAAMGGGRFRNFEKAEDIDFLDLVETSVHRTYDLTYVVASNRNARLHVAGNEVLALRPDSDADGLTDWEEIEELGTNPEKPDTDGDGCRDGVEVFKGQWPLTEIEPAPEGIADPCGIQSFDGKYEDTDKDGLFDREELLVVLTNRWQPDSDIDGLSDGLEVFRGSKPHHDDVRVPTDVDEDGVFDFYEVRAHTLPSYEEDRYDAGARDEYSYSYVRTYATTGDKGSRCYDVTIENVTLVETKAAQMVNGEALTAGENVIDVYLVQHVEGITNPPSTIRTAAVTATFPSQPTGDNSPYVLALPDEELILLR